MKRPDLRGGRDIEDLEGKGGGGRTKHFQISKKPSWPQPGSSKAKRMHE